MGRPFKLNRHQQSEAIAAEGVRNSATNITRGRIRGSAKTPRSARAPSHEGAQHIRRLIVWERRNLRRDKPAAARRWVTTNCTFA